MSPSVLPRVAATTSPAEQTWLVDEGKTGAWRNPQQHSYEFICNALQVVAPLEDRHVLRQIPFAHPAERPQEVPHPVHSPSSVLQWTSRTSSPSASIAQVLLGPEWSTVRCTRPW